MLRPRLQELLLSAVQNHRLTLIAAPAGSGKTIHASSLTQSGLPTIWVALDKSDALPRWSAVLFFVGLLLLMFPIYFISRLLGAVLWLIMGVWITWHVVAEQRSEHQVAIPHLT